MKKITISGMSSYEKKELVILDREKIEEILNDLLPADIYRQTRAEAEKWSLTGTAYTYIDIETGEIETDWIQQNNFLHPFESTKRIWIMSEKTPAYQWPAEDLLDSDEMEQYDNWRDDEDADNFGKGHEEFIEEVFGDLKDRQENCIEANAVESDLDWENILEEIDRIYEGAEDVDEEYDTSYIEQQLDYADEAKVAVSIVENLTAYKNFLNEKGYNAELDPSTDYLIVTRK